MAQQYVGLDSTNTSMGLVEILEPHDRAYFTAFLVDIHESGQKNLVRSVCDCARRVRWAGRARGRFPGVPRAEDLAGCRRWSSPAGASLLERSARGLYTLRTFFAPFERGGSTGTNGSRGKRREARRRRYACKSVCIWQCSTPLLTYKRCAGTSMRKSRRGLKQRACALGRSPGRRRK
jgi:hypothetical protein